MCYGHDIASFVLLFEKTGILCNSNLKLTIVLLIVGKIYSILITYDYRCERRDYMDINNTGNLPEQFLWRDDVGLTTKSLGEAAGSQKIYVNIDYVPPKAYSTKYHSHSQQEEFFMILSGTGTLRINDEEKVVSQGDFIAKPAGKNIAHTFYNSGDEILAILDVGTNESEDTCYYPDEDMYMQKSNGIRRIFKGTDLSASWMPEPNPKE
jgi:uncharacterized cupin superfamily protein